MVCVEIDEITPCLRDVKTGLLVSTVVRRIRNRDLLKEYTIESGWYVNWEELYDNHEIYALYVKGDECIQGLIALYPDCDTNALYIAWMCAAPCNSKGAGQRYSGVGGHLFAVAADRSFHYGLNGDMYGFAANKGLCDHYSETFGAILIGTLHKYHFVITSSASRKIMEVYDYDYEFPTKTDKR